MKRNEIRGRSIRIASSPGLRVAPSGLQVPTLSAEQQAEAPGLQRDGRSQDKDNLQQCARRQEREDVGHVMLPGRAIGSRSGSGNRSLSGYALRTPSFRDGA